MQSMTGAATARWSDDLNLVLIYTLVLGVMGYLTAVASIPDRAAVAPVQSSVTARAD